MIRFFLSLCFAVVPQIQFAQSQPVNDPAIPFLTLAPDSLQSSILILCESPEALRVLSGQRKASRRQFSEWLNKQPEVDRSPIWTLSRFPRLLDTLISSSNFSEQHLEPLLSPYPFSIHQLKGWLMVPKRHHSLLQLQTRLTDNAKAEQSMLRGLKGKTRKAVECLLAHPAYLELVMVRPKQVQASATAFAAKYPKGSEKLQEASQALEAQLLQQTLGWANRVNSYETAKTELFGAAASFPYPSGADEKLRGYGSTSAELATTRPRVVDQPYFRNGWNFWVGHPSVVFTDPWAPLPSWASAGVLKTTESYEVVSTPSLDFVTYHFQQVEVLERFSHLADLLLWESESNKRLKGGIYTYLKEWRKQNGAAFPGDWLRADDRRADRLAEFARLEQGYMQVMDESPNPPSRESVVLENQGKYPALAEFLNNPNGSPGKRSVAPSLAARQPQQLAGEMRYYRALEGLREVWNAR